MESKLLNIIEQLINSRREGEWWDFKQEHQLNKADLILDIICMANSLEKQDSLIIYGVEDKTYRIVGVENDSNRRKQQDVIQILETAKFAGDNRPIINLSTFKIKNHDIDVLLIKNTNKTPYFLSEKYSFGNKTVREGNIYTRIGDKNTPINKCADIYYIEKLWKKRFGLDCDIMTKANATLDDYEKWHTDWGNKKYAFSESNPEFQLVIDGEYRTGWEPIAAFYLAPSFHFTNMRLMVYNTIIYETELWALDDYRKYLPRPSISCIAWSGKRIYYFYYSLDSIEGRILKINTRGTMTLNSREPDFKNRILIFKNDQEKDAFNNFFESIIDNLDVSMIKNKSKYYIMQDNEQNGGGRCFSSLHIAIASEAYEMWINLEHA